MTATKVCFTDFRAFFLENIDRRSRSAKVVSATSTSSIKQELLKTGQELIAQVRKNTERLIEHVWENRTLNPIKPYQIEFLDEEWNDIINHDLFPENAYEKEYTEMRLEFNRRRGRGFLVFDERYRLWNVPYTSLQLAPFDIYTHMHIFYRELAIKIPYARNDTLLKEELLAYADYTIDKAIHPWRDGCGRSATAMIMWLSLLTPDLRLPLFGPREMHHYSMIDLCTHIDYFRRCLNHEFK